MECGKEIGRDVLVGQTRGSRLFGPKRRGACG